MAGSSRRQGTRGRGRGRGRGGGRPPRPPPPDGPRRSNRLLRSNPGGGSNSVVPRNSSSSNSSSRQQVDDSTATSSDMGSLRPGLDEVTASTSGARSFQRGLNPHSNGSNHRGGDDSTASASDITRPFRPRPDDPTASVGEAQSFQRHLNDQQTADPSDMGSLRPNNSQASTASPADVPSFVRPPRRSKNQSQNLESHTQENQDPQNQQNIGVPNEVKVYPRRSIGSLTIDTALVADNASSSPTNSQDELWFQNPTGLSSLLIYKCDVGKNTIDFLSNGSQLLNPDKPLEDHKSLKLRVPAGSTKNSSFLFAVRRSGGGLLPVYQLNGSLLELKEDEHNRKAPIVIPKYNVTLDPSPPTTTTTTSSAMRPPTISTTEDDEVEDSTSTNQSDAKSTAVASRRNVKEDTKDQSNTTSTGTDMARSTDDHPVGRDEGLSNKENNNMAQNDDGDKKTRAISSSISSSSDPRKRPKAGTVVGDGDDSEQNDFGIANDDVDIDDESNILDGSTKIDSQITVKITGENVNNDGGRFEQSGWPRVLSIETAAKSSGSQFNVIVQWEKDGEVSKPTGLNRILDETRSINQEGGLNFVKNVYAFLHAAGRDFGNGEGWGRLILLLPSHLKRRTQAKVRLEKERQSKEKAQQLEQEQGSRRKTRSMAKKQQDFPKSQANNTRSNCKPPQEEEPGARVLGDGTTYGTILKEDSCLADGATFIFMKYGTKGWRNTRSPNAAFDKTRALLWKSEQDPTKTSPPNKTKLMNLIRSTTIENHGVCLDVMKLRSEYNNKQEVILSELVGGDLLLICELTTSKQEKTKHVFTVMDSDDAVMITDQRVGTTDKKRKSETGEKQRKIFDNTGHTAIAFMPSEVKEKQAAQATFLGMFTPAEDVKWVNVTNAYVIFDKATPPIHLAGFLVDESLGVSKGEHVAMKQKRYKEWNEKARNGESVAGTSGNATISTESNQQASRNNKKRPKPSPSNVLESSSGPDVSANESSNNDGSQPNRQRTPNREGGSIGGFQHDVQATNQVRQRGGGIGNNNHERRDEEYARPRPTKRCRSSLQQEGQESIREVGSHTPPSHQNNNQNHSGASYNGGGGQYGYRGQNNDDGRRRNNNNGDSAFRGMPVRETPDNHYHRDNQNNSGYTHPNANFEISDGNRFSGGGPGDYDDRDGYHDGGRPGMPAWYDGGRRPLESGHHSNNYGPDNNRQRDYNSGHQSYPYGQRSQHPNSAGNRYSYNGGNREGYRNQPPPQFGGGYGDGYHGPPPSSTYSSMAGSHQSNPYHHPATGHYPSGGPSHGGNNRGGFNGPPPHYGQQNHHGYNNHGDRRWWLEPPPDRSDRGRGGNYG